MSRSVWTKSSSIVLMSLVKKPMGSSLLMVAHSPPSDRKAAAASFVPCPLLGASRCRCVAALGHLAVLLGAQTGRGHAGDGRAQLILPPGHDVASPSIMATVSF